MRSAVHDFSQHPDRAKAGVLSWGSRTLILVGLETRPGVDFRRLKLSWNPEPLKPVHTDKWKAMILYEASRLE